MKKLLLLVCLIGSASSLLANMRCDVTTGRFFSIPATREINQDEYHSLFIQCGIIQILAMNSGKLGKKYEEQTTSFLKGIGTPTALRLLADFTLLQPN